MLSSGLQAPQAVVVIDNGHNIPFSSGNVGSEDVLIQKLWGAISFIFMARFSNYYEVIEAHSNLSPSLTSSIKDTED